MSDFLCASADILASSCVNGICEHEFKVSSSECASSARTLHNIITIVVAGSNLLGVGQSSVPVNIPGTLLGVYYSCVMIY